MGLSRVEELEAKCSELEKLHQEAVQARDEAIEERNRATVVLAFQLEKETNELANHIEDLNKKNQSILDENEDLSIKLEYARKDLKTLQKKHINLQLESERHTNERDEANEKVKVLQEKNEALLQQVNTLLENSRKADFINYNNNNPIITITNCCSDDEDDSITTNTNSNTINSNNSKKTDTNTSPIGKKSATTANNSSNNNNSNNTNCNHHTNINNSSKSTSNSNNRKNKESVIASGKHIEENSNSSHIKRNKTTRDKERKSNITMDEELEPRPPITIKKTALDADYDVHEELGKGKFGVVKRATSKTDNKVYAAKYIKTSASAAGSSRDEVLREIDIMGRLHHKRLVGLLDAYESGRTIIMIMEFVSGGELFERVVDEDCLTEKEAAYYMHQILQGLHHMHNKNILHLDLKPENIVCVSKDSWEIKLIDFGLAQELIPGRKMKAMKGTPEFMAPETVNFETISKPADMWSVGVIAYILLSGLSPFMGDDNNETLSNVNTAEWDFDDEAFDVISDQAKGFISQLLIKNPRKRNTVEACLEHEWMKKSESANAVKIDTKKLKQFLAKRRWQKSVNALVAVRRLSSMSSLLGLNKSRPSIAPMLSELPAGEEENEEEEEDSENETKKIVDQKVDGRKTEQADSKKPVQVNGTLSLEKKSRIGERKFQKKPAFTKELEDISVCEGDSVTMEVIINGDPGCEVEWFFEGGEINEREGVTIVNHGDGTHGVIIDECEEEDTGEYCCVFENDAGRATTRGYLTVEVESNEESGADIDPPVFTKELTGITAKEGETVTMELVVSGEDYELEWFKNAVDIEEGERFSFRTDGKGKHALVITNVEDDDTGEYCCVAQNDGGRNTCAGYFTVEVEGEDEESDEETDEEFFKENDTIKKEYIEDFYAMEEEIGRGRFGIVRKCVHIKTGIHFVAKFIKARPSQKEEFKREIDVMNVLRHPTLCRLREAFEKSRELVIVMEYNRGGDLLQHINELPMSEPDTVGILQQILEALNYMHDNSYMHLDIKPENVMFKREGGTNIKLIDFSLARKFDPKVETKISQGTAEYVAPEVVNYDSVSPATDMWAVGITTYMMLSGISPFLCESEAETFTNITQCNWKFTEVFNDVSDEAKEFIKKLLVKKKTARMTAADCLEHPWITTVGRHREKTRTTSRMSHGTSLSDISNSLLSNGDLHESISSMESFLRLNSTSDDVFAEEGEEKKQSVDTKELEATLQTLLLKLREVEGERAELEEKLKAEETKAEKLKESLSAKQREHTEKISKLEKQNESFASQVKSKNDLLVKIGDLETQRKELEERLEEKSKSQKNMEEKYSNLRIKMDQYDSLEEKMYRYEREKKENLLTNKKLEEKLKECKAVEKDLQSEQLKQEEKKTQELSKIRKEKEEVEEKYRKLVEEKEKLVSELSNKFKVLERQKKDAMEQKDILEKRVKDLENEYKTVEEDLKNKCLSSLEKDKKKATELSNLRKERDETEEKYNKLRKEKDNLVSELTKKFTVMEKQKKDSAEQKEALERKVKNLENELKKRNREFNEVNQKLEKSNSEVESLKKKIAAGKEMEIKITTLNGEKSELEKEGNKLKKEKEEARKTCEELASKLSKSYGEVEKLKMASHQTKETQNLKKENEELKKKLTLEEEKSIRLKKDLELNEKETSTLQKELKTAKKSTNILDLRKRNSMESNSDSSSDSETLKTTILDLESTILTHKSTIAVSKGEIELLQEKLSLAQEEKEQLRNELHDRKRDIDKLKGDKSKIIFQCEENLDEAQDCYEESKKELITKYEKRIKDLEKERDDYDDRTESRGVPYVVVKQNHPEKITEKVVRFLFESLNDLKSSKADNLAEQFLDIIKTQIEMIVFNFSTPAENVDALVKELHLVIEASKTEVLQTRDDLELSRMKNELLEQNSERVKPKELEICGDVKVENELLQFRGNDVKKTFKEQSKEIFDANNDEMLKQNAKQSFKQNVELFESTRKEIELLKLREVELCEENKKQSIELLEAGTIIEVLKQNAEQVEHTLECFKNIQREHGLLKIRENEVNKRNKELCDKLQVARDRNNMLEEEAKLIVQRIKWLENVDSENNMLKLREHKLKEMNQEQIKNINDANDKIEMLEQQVKNFKEEKSIGLKMMEELEGICESQKQDLKELEELKNHHSNLEGNYDELKMDFERQKRELERKTEEIGMLHEENEYFSAEVERLRKERVEGYQLFTQMEEKNSHLKEELRQVRQVLRVYKAEYSKMKSQATQESMDLERKLERVGFLENEIRKANEVNDALVEGNSVLNHEKDKLKQELDHLQRKTFECKTGFDNLFAEYLKVLSRVDELEKIASMHRKEDKSFMDKCVQTKKETTKDDETYKDKNGQP